MKSTQFLNETTTAGSVASVSMPFKATQKRTSEDSTNVTTKKSKKKYANSLTEGKMKDLFVDLKLPPNGLSDEDFLKKYNKTKKEMRNLFKNKQEQIKEQKLEEEDLIIVPGQGRRLKSGFVPHGQSRVDHEVEMARSDLFQAHKNAKKIYNLIKDRDESEGLEGWVQEKIIKANDYLNTVREYLEHKTLTKEGMKGAMLGGVAGAVITKTPQGALSGANIGSEIEDMFKEEITSGGVIAGGGVGEGMAEGLNEFAPDGFNGGDDRDYEYEVYQCKPEDQFDWIGGPIYKTDDMGKAHGIAYNLYKKHPNKAFMIWQERTEGSRGGYGIKDDEQGVAEGWKEKVGAAALAGSMALGSPAQAQSIAQSIAQGIGRGMTSAAGSSVIDKNRNAADEEFAKQIPDEKDRETYLKALKQIKHSRALAYSSPAMAGANLAREQNFKKLKHQMAEKYNILMPVKEQDVAEGLKKFTYKVDVPEGTGNYLGGIVFKFVAANDDEAKEIARKKQGRNLRRVIGYDNSIKVPMTSGEKPLSPWYRGVGGVPANFPANFKTKGVAEATRPSSITVDDDRPEHKLHAELVYKHGADKLKKQYEVDGDANKLITNIQKLSKLKYRMNIDASTARWIAKDLVYPERLAEEGVAEGLEDSNIQGVIVDTVERLFRKNNLSDYGALEAIRQGVKHHFSKPGATTESAIEGILNILDKRMRKSGNYVELGRFKEALRQGVAHQLKKQGVAEGLEKKDMTGKTCEKCKKDTYQERSLRDDWEGTLRCSCGHVVDRWRKYKKKDDEQGVAEGWDVRKDDIRQKIYKYEDLALAANKAGDDEKCKMYQKKIQSLKQKMAKGVTEGLSKQFEIIYLDQSGERKRKIVSGTSKESVARQFKKQYKLEIEQVKQLQQGVAEGTLNEWVDPGAPCTHCGKPPGQHSVRFDRKNPKLRFINPDDEWNDLEMSNAEDHEYVPSRGYKPLSQKEAELVGFDNLNVDMPDDIYDRINSVRQRISRVGSSAGQLTRIKEQGVAEGTGVTDYNLPSKGGTRKELLAKYHKTKNPKDAQAARKAGATQKELQGDKKENNSINEMSNDLAKDFADFLKSTGRKYTTGRPPERPQPIEPDLTDEIAKLPMLKQQYQDMVDQYNKRNGDSWRYADREQNLSPFEKENREMWYGPITKLWRKIQELEKAKNEQNLEEDSTNEKTFRVTYYSKKLDKNVTKKMKAENESDIWNKFMLKNIDVVSIEQLEDAK